MGEEVSSEAPQHQDAMPVPVEVGSPTHHTQKNR